MKLSSMGQEKKSTKKGGESFQLCSSAKYLVLKKGTGGSPFAAHKGKRSSRGEALAGIGGNARGGVLGQVASICGTKWEAAGAERGPGGVKFRATSIGRHGGLEGNLKKRIHGTRARWFG